MGAFSSNSHFGGLSVGKLNHNTQTMTQKQTQSKHLYHYHNQTFQKANSGGVLVEGVSGCLPAVNIWND